MSIIAVYLGLSGTASCLRRMPTISKFEAPLELKRYQSGVKRTVGRSLRQRNAKDESDS